MTWEGLLENIVADLAFVLLLVPFGATAVLIVTRWRPHSRLLRFLGCDSEHPNIIVFFSTLNVLQGGSVDFRGTARSYSGPAVPESEFLVERTISDALEAPVQGWISRLLANVIHRVPGRWLRNWLGLRDVSVDYRLSPLVVPTKLPDEVTICLGSPGYNYASDFYLSNLAPLLVFSAAPSPQIQQPGSGPITHSGDVGMLQRLRVSDGHVVHIAAGIGTNGTRGALEFLFSNWRRLERAHGQKDYALALGFPWFHQDPFGFHRPIKLLELSRP